MSDVIMVRGAEDPAEEQAVLTAIAAARDISVAARDASLIHRDQSASNALSAFGSATNAAGAHANAVAAANATGPVLIYATRAEADSAASGLDDGQRVEVEEDETRNGRRTRYVVASGSLEFAIYLPAGREVVVNVLDYGAKGDGVADDTASIQAAVDAVGPLGAGVVLLPKGAYRVTARINVTGETAVVGAGKHLTRMIPDASHQDYVFRVQGGVESRFKRVEFRGFWMDGQNRPPIAERTVQGFGRIRCTHVDNVKVTDVHGTNTDGLIEFRGCYFGEVRNITCNDCYEGAISFLADCKFFVVSDCVLEDVGEAFDFTWECSDIHISNVWASAGYLDDEAIDLESCERVTFTGCTFTGFVFGVLGKCQEGFPYNDIIFQGCRFLNCQGVAMRFTMFNDPEEDCHDIKIIGCVVESVGGHAILFEAGAGRKFETVLISGCTIRATDNGVRALDCHHLSVLDNNEIASSGGMAVWVGGSGAMPAVANPVVRGNVSLSAGSTSASAAAIYIERARDPVVEGNQVEESATQGVRVRNCLRPRIIGNHVRHAARHGIWVDWNNIDFLDAGIIDAIVDANVVRNFGIGVNQRRGILLEMVLGAGETGTYEFASISANRIYCDSNADAQTRAAVALVKGDLAEFDYVKIDNNLSYGAGVFLVGDGFLGSNSTQVNNTSKS